ncbi:MAG TPA: AAA family ATPase [Rhizomicrobium sp.]|nr:AAA family ATPase [Rhizomicrobium sp.]
MKDVVVLGGPNGAGKTTAARELVPEKLGIQEFVNADEIARGLSPRDPERVAIAAGRLMLERMHSLARDRQSFAFETMCSETLQGRWLARESDVSVVAFTGGRDCASCAASSDGRTWLTDACHRAPISGRAGEYAQTLFAEG